MGASQGSSRVRRVRLTSLQSLSCLAYLATIVIFLVFGDAAGGTSASEQSQQGQGPYILRAEEKGDTSVGLLYTPELLATLVARRTPESVPARLAEAVRQQTPVVVMWKIPATADFGPIPTPYKMAIVEHDSGSPATDPNRIEPAWIQQDASELVQLDSRLRPEDVGAVAAFPRAAFLPGRRISLYSDYPIENRGLRVHSRSGRVEWDGRSRVSR